MIVSTFVSGLSLKLGSGSLPQTFRLYGFLFLHIIFVPLELDRLQKDVGQKNEKRGAPTCLDGSSDRKSFLAVIKNAPDFSGAFSLNS